MITDIQDQRRRKGRVSVFLDGEFWCGMSQFCKIELGLEPGMELDDDAKKNAEKHVADNEAVMFCVERLSERPRTVHQITEKMLAREYSEEVIEYAIKRCEEMYLINDRYYAEVMASNKLSSGMGRRRVAEKLRQDGVEREMMEEVLDEIFIPEEEEEYATTALSYKFKGPLTFRDQRRAQGFLLRRGFSSSAVQAAVGSLGKAEEERPTNSSGEYERPAGMDAQEAEALLRRKYPRLNPADIKDYRRAQGFLLRRGCSFDVVREAITALRTS